MELKIPNVTQLGGGVAKRNGAKRGAKGNLIMLYGFIGLGDMAPIIGSLPVSGSRASVRAEDARRRGRLFKRRPVTNVSIAGPSGAASFEVVGVTHRDLAAKLDAAGIAVSFDDAPRNVGVMDLLSSVSLARPRR